MGCAFSKEGCASGVSCALLRNVSVLEKGSDMSKEDKSGFLKTAFDGIDDVAANRINERLREAAPQIIDWIIDKLVSFGVQKFNNFKANYKKTKVERLLASRNENSENAIALARAADAYKSEKSDATKNELVRRIGFELCEDKLLRELMNLFTREVVCPYCNESIIDNWYDHVIGESTSERNMGTEDIYSIECDDFQCPKCKKVFIVEGFICSYPDGIYDSHQLRTSAV
jgi:uncharacterized protein with PIN domain